VLKIATIEINLSLQAYHSINWTSKTYWNKTK